MQRYCKHKTISAVSAQAILFCSCLFFLSIANALTTDIYPFALSAEANRFAVLTQEIRCVVCQNQSIADSNAPLAHDLREKIYHMVLEKKSNAEIKNYLVRRYGDFILFNPRFNFATFALWFFPFFALILVLCVFLRMKKAAVSADSEKKRQPLFLDLC